MCPDRCGSVGEVLQTEGPPVRFQSGHMPDCRLDPWIGVCERHQSMLLLHIDVSLPFFLSPFSSL